MSANSSSSISSLLQPHLCVDPFFFTIDQCCSVIRPSSFIFTAFNITNVIFLLPLIIVILYSGWQQKLSRTSTSTMSHFDCFTYHTVIMEIFNLPKLVSYLYGTYTNDLKKTFIGSLLSSFIWYGETSFHVLTCVERYLAVVHPITYLNLRNERGIRVRNTSICCVWLLSFVRLGLFVKKEVSSNLDFLFSIIPILVTLFCSLSVLCVLIRPGPGEKARKRADQSKQKAFYTIAIILSVLVLRFISSMIWIGMDQSKVKDLCLILAGLVWSNLPSSLVLPLLFLHKRGKFMCCKYKK